MNLLENSVDVGRVGLLSGLLCLLLVTRAGALGLGGGLLGSLRWGLAGRHGCLTALGSGGLGSRGCGLGCLYEPEGSCVRMANGWLGSLARCAHHCDKELYGLKVGGGLCVTVKCLIERVGRRSERRW